MPRLSDLRPEAAAGATAALLTALSIGFAESPHTPAPSAETPSAPTAAAPVVPASLPSEPAPLHGDLRVFFGNLHSHTGYSDPFRGRPAPILFEARR